MKIDYEFSEDNLKHLDEFSHFRDEYADKVRCVMDKLVVHSSD